MTNTLSSSSLLSLLSFCFFWRGTIRFVPICLPFSLPRTAHRRPRPRPRWGPSLTGTLLSFQPATIRGTSARQALGDHSWTECRSPDRLPPLHPRRPPMGTTPEVRTPSTLHILLPYIAKENSSCFHFRSFFKPTARHYSD